MEEEETGREWAEGRKGRREKEEKMVGSQMRCERVMWRWTAFFLQALGWAGHRKVRGCLWASGALRPLRGQGA